MKASCLMTICAVLVAFQLNPLVADQVVMQNGDTLNGTVLSVTTNLLVLKNENLGVMTLPRAKVASINLGSFSTPVALTNLELHQPVVASTNANADLRDLFRDIRANSNLVQQVESQILGASTPEATGKFNELLDGLSTGKIDMNDLRAQAQSAVQELRSLKKDLGPDAGDELNSYLDTLNAFLQESGPANAPTNASLTAPDKKPDTQQPGP